MSNQHQQTTYKKWLTPEEVRELIDRAKRLLRSDGVDSDNDIYSRRFIATRDALNTIEIFHFRDGTLAVGDPNATVMTADFDTGAIREFFGGSARGVLLRMRDLMLLDDLANV